MIIKLVGAINDLLWGDLIILEFSGGEVQFGLSLLVLILIPAGLYFTFKTKFLPFRVFPEMIRVTLEKDDAKKDENSISGVQALIVATATRVGMGNLAGVVAAISFGGAGAVFWMWLTALIGSSSSFVESTLAQIYKEKDPLYGGYRGGPAYVMDRIRLVTKIKREDVFVKNVKEEAEYVADDEQTYYTRGCKYGLRNRIRTLRTALLGRYQPGNRKLRYHFLPERIRYPAGCNCYHSGSYVRSHRSSQERNC